MASRVEKQATVSELVAKLRRAQTVALADYRGLNVAQMTDLRQKAREAQIELRVIKNTLAIRAAEEAGMEPMSELLKGPTAVAISYDNPAAPAKLLVDFARTARQLEIKGGMVVGRLFSAADIRALATLPSREVLLTQVVSAMQMPLASMASVLAAPMRGLVTALEAVRKQREEAAD